MKRMLIVFAGLVFAVTAQSPVYGEFVLVDHQPPVTDESNALISNLPSPEGTLQQIADDFQVPFDATASDISWSGIYFGRSLPSALTTVQFTLRLFAGSTSAPSSSAIVDEVVPAFFTQTGVGTGSSHDPIYRFSASLGTPVALVEGETYWLSVLDSDANTTVNFRWLKSSKVLDGISASRSTDGSTWNRSPVDFAFTISAVPEPSTFVLLASAVMVIGGHRLLRWRKR